MSMPLPPLIIGNEEYPLLHPSRPCPVPNPEYASESKTEDRRLKELAGQKFQFVVAAELPSPILNRAKSRHTSEFLSHSNERFASLRACSLVLQLVVGALVIASVSHSADMDSPQIRTFRFFIIITTVGGISIALTDFVTWRWTCRAEPNADQAKMISRISDCLHTLSLVHQFLNGILVIAFSSIHFSSTSLIPGSYSKTRLCALGTVQFLLSGAFLWIWGSEEPYSNMAMAREGRYKSYIFSVQLAYNH